MRRLSWLHRIVVFLAGTACSDPQIRPHEVDRCALGVTTVDVLVVDASGAPAPEAVIVAEHVDTQLSASGYTDARGKSTAVTELLGQGTVRVFATRGSKRSTFGEVRFDCSDACHCYPEPSSLTLQLSP